MRCISKGNTVRVRDRVSTSCPENYLRTHKIRVAHHTINVPEKWKNILEGVKRKSGVLKNGPTSLAAFSVPTTECSVSSRIADVGSISRSSALDSRAVRYSQKCWPAVVCVDTARLVPASLPISVLESSLCKQG